MGQWQLVKWSVGITIVFFILIFFINGISEDSLRINIRWSARFAAAYFAIAFGSSSFQYFKKGLFSFWLIGNRKYFGITYALVHLIHLLFIVVLHQAYHPIFNIAATSSLIGGGIAYAFTFVMLITSFSQFQSKISHRVWKVIHTIGGYWIWAIFFISYLKRVDTEIEYLPMIIIFMVVMLLRVSKLMHNGFR
ncbi:MAG: hypothetical protein V3V00_09130 [Saprospiraceae bacterium]